MAAKKLQNWERAKALYGAGKTPRQIEDEIGIPRATFQRKANEEGWIKGNLSQDIKDVARVSQLLSQKSEPERAIIEKEASKILKAKGLHLDAGIMLAELVLEVAKEERTTKSILNATQALTNTAKLTGVVDFYPPKEKSKTEINIQHQPKNLSDFYDANKHILNEHTKSLS